MWDPGFIITTTIVAIIAIICFAVSTLMYGSIDHTRDLDTVYNYEEFTGRHRLWTARGALIAGIVFVLLTVLTPFPYEKKFLYWEDTSGIVETVDSRMVSSGDGFEEKFVVTFQGNPKEYGCVDTRCATIRPGDNLTLKCMWDEYCHRRTSIMARALASRLSQSR